MLTALLALQATLSNPDLLVASRNTDEILRYDAVTGGFLGVFTRDPLLGNPVGITFGPDGNVFVASADLDRVLEVDRRTGAVLRTFAEGGGLVGPRQVNFGPDGDLYVASGSTDQVLRYDGVTGAFRGVFAQGGGLDGPTGFTFGPGGDLFVGSVLTDQVLRYDGRSGAFLGVFASRHLDGPHDLSFGPDGFLYVTNAFTNDVVRFRPRTGAFAGSFIDDGRLVTPLGLTWEPEGTLLVANQGRNNVLRYDARTGAFLGRAVRSGTGGLDGPLFAIRRAARVLDVGAPSPGVAGGPSYQALTGGSPGGLVAIVAGWLPGRTPLPGCPGTWVPLHRPLLVAFGLADEAGGLLTSYGIDESLLGTPIRFHALDLGRCAVSGARTVVVPGAAGRPSPGGRVGG